MTRNIEDEAELIADNIECATQRRWGSEDERSTAVLNIKAGLERQLAAKDAEIAALRAACEAVVDKVCDLQNHIDDEPYGDGTASQAWAVAQDKLVASILATAQSALAATAGGEGE